MYQLNRINILTIAYLLLLSSSSLTHAQQVYTPFVFNNIPQDFQLYPRDDNKLATIPISGIVQNKGWKTISVLVYREGKIYGSQKSKIQINTSDDSFSLSPTIKAEKAEYSLKIYASENNIDSTFITERKNIVAGDFYVIYGDSNGNTQNVSPIEYYSKNRFIRTFGRFEHERQANYQAKDTTWSQNENYYLPKVGIWGTHLQEYIAERYDIPVCIITGGGPGMHLGLQTDRTDNPFSMGGVYNTMAYRVKKSGLIDHIKGFFLWHGVYELFSLTDPVDYENKLKKMMTYLNTDFPKTKQFILFQSGIVRFNLNGFVGANIRESQRKIATQFPKVIPYNTIGLEGFDGVHYSNQGYEKCAEEMLKILEPLYYGKAFDVNNLSPNLQKVYYEDQTHKSIKLVFQDNEKLVIGNDTTISVNGSNVNLSLKKYFYFNQKYTQDIGIQNITNDKNTISVQLNSPQNAKTLSYLPPYHFDYSESVPTFIGPYLKNLSGQRALAFADVVIQEPIGSISNLTGQVTRNQVNLRWTIQSIPKNAVTIIERKYPYENAFSQIKTIDASLTQFQDINLPSDTQVDYRLQIISDSSASAYTQISARTLASLGSPKINSLVLYNNKVQIFWLVPNGADKLVIQKRLKTNNHYVSLLNTNNFQNLKSLIDSSLTPNQTYIFKIITSRNNDDEKTVDSLEIATPAILSKPELSSIVIFYNALKVSWKSISGATKYRLDRKTENEDFKTIGTLNATITSFQQDTLKPNTTYTYRLKAFSDLSESLESEISVKTPDILTTPELTSENITHESIKLNWKKIINSTKYTLERQAQDETAFQKIFDTDSLLTFTDSKLKSNLSYSYRLRATSNVSESAYAKIDVKTLSILANQNVVNTKFNIFPNPTKDKLNISFSEPLTGQISLIDLSGKNIFEQKIMKQQNHLLDVSSLKKGIYLVIISSNQELYSQKIIVE